MENDNVFEADAEIEYGGRGKRSQRTTGAKAAMSATGAFAADADAFEETPLLSRADSIDESDGGGDGEQRPLVGDPELSPFAHLPWWRRPSVFWLLPPFLLSAASFGGAMVPKINIVLSLLCERYFAEQTVDDPTIPVLPIIIGGDNKQCQIPEVQALVASFQLAAGILVGVISALVSPILGAYSDRHGRVRVIAFTVVGGIFGDLITIVVVRYSHIFSPYWLLAMYVTEGATGTFLASMALTYAYATDCTPEHRRDVTFGYVQGCLFTGIALGPIMAAYIVRATGDLMSMIYVLVGAHCFFVTWVSLVVPESLTEARQREARDKRAAERDKATAADASAAGARPPDFPNLSFAERALDAAAAVGRGLLRSDFFAALRVLWPTGPGSTPALRRNLVLLAAIDTCNFAVAMGIFTVLVLYVELRYAWGTFETQVLTAVVNTVRVTMLLVGLPLLARLKARAGRGGAPGATARQQGSRPLDLAVVRVSVVIDLLGYVGFALAPTGGWFLAAGTLCSLGSLASPTLGAALTRHVPPDRIGRLLGATALLHALARVGGPVVFNAIYAATVKTVPVTVFVVLAALFAGVVVMSWFLRPYIYYDESAVHAAETEHSPSEERPTQPA